MGLHCLPMPLYFVRDFSIENFRTFTVTFIPALNQCFISEARW